MKTFDEALKKMLSVFSVSRLKALVNALEGEGKAEEAKKIRTNSAALRKGAEAKRAEADALATKENRNAADDEASKKLLDEAGAEEAKANSDDERAALLEREAKEKLNSPGCPDCGGETFLCKECGDQTCGHCEEDSHEDDKECGDCFKKLNENRNAQDCPDCAEVLKDPKILTEAYMGDISETRPLVKDGVRHLEVLPEEPGSGGWQTYCGDPMKAKLNAFKEAKEKKADELKAAAESKEKEVSLNNALKKAREEKEEAERKLREERFNSLRKVAEDRDAGVIAGIPMGVMAPDDKEAAGASRYGSRK